MPSKKIATCLQSANVVPVSGSKQIVTLASSVDFVLLQCSGAMSDRSQIQARIRKARVTADPAGQLAPLYARTLDPMEAFAFARPPAKPRATHYTPPWYP